ncbi:MAG: hypothetical protein R2880_12465 [Deinococcales bacterium]
MSTFGEFGTARLVGGLELDFVRSRSNTTFYPGALPQVSPADILSDLKRRDFSINAMALRLDRPLAEPLSEGDFLDPFQGSSPQGKKTHSP